MVTDNCREVWCSPVADEISNPGLNCTIVLILTLLILLLRFVLQLYLGKCACTISFCARALFIFLNDVCAFSSLNNILILLCVIFLTYVCCPWLCSHCGWLLLKCSAIGIGFNGAETNCGIAHILGIQYWWTVTTRRYNYFTATTIICSRSTLNCFKFLSLHKKPEVHDLRTSNFGPGALCLWHRIEWVKNANLESQRCLYNITNSLNEHWIFIWWSLLLTKPFFRNLFASSRLECHSIDVSP